MRLHPLITHTHTHTQCLMYVECNSPKWQLLQSAVIQNIYVISLIVTHRQDQTTSREPDNCCERLYVKKIKNNL